MSFVVIGSEIQDDPFNSQPFMLSHNPHHPRHIPIMFWQGTQATQTSEELCLDETRVEMGANRKFGTNLIRHTAIKSIYNQ